MLIGSLLGFILLSLIAFLVPIDSPGIGRLLVPTISFLLFLPALRGLRDRKLDFFEIIYPVCASYFIYFVLVYLEPDRESGLRFGWLTSATLNQAFLYMGLGFACLLWGYYLPLSSWLSKGLPQPRLSVAPRKGHGAIYLFWLFGTALRLFLLAHGSHTWSVKMEEILYGSALPGQWGNITGYLSQFALLAYVAATCHYFSPEKPRFPALFLWGVMLPAELLWTFLQASKLTFLGVLAAPMIAYNYLQKRATVRHVAPPLMIFVFIVFPVVGVYRDVAANYPIRLATLHRDLPAAIREVVKELTSPEVEVDIGSGAELVAERAEGLFPVANVIKYVELRGTAGGATLWQLPLVVIPGSFLPQKQELLASTGLLYAEDISGAKKMTAGIALTQMGEFYLNFGLLGVLIGMFLQGVLYRFWQEYWPKGRGAFGIAFFIVGWRYLILIEVPFAFCYGLIIREFIMTVIIFWVAKLWPRSQTAEAA